MLFEIEFIKIYSNIDQALSEYSIFLRTKLSNWFDLHSNDKNYHTLEQDFYRFQICFENIFLEDLFSSFILHRDQNIPDLIAIESKIDNNEFVFEHLNKVFTLQKSQCMIFPYSEIYNIKNPKNYYAVSFNQQQ